MKPRPRDSPVGGTAPVTLLVGRASPDFSSRARRHHRAPCDARFTYRTSRRRCRRRCLGCPSTPIAAHRRPDTARTSWMAPGGPEWRDSIRCRCDPIRPQAQLIRSPGHGRAPSPAPPVRVGPHPPVPGQRTDRVPTVRFTAPGPLRERCGRRRKRKAAGGDPAPVAVSRNGARDIANRPGPAERGRAGSLLECW